MTMTRRLAAFFAAALCCGLAQAQPAPTCPPAAHAPSAAELQAALPLARDRGFLWRLVKDGRSAYLYGTVHVGRIEWLLPGPTVAAALAASDSVALELDPLDAEVQRRVLLALTAGEPLPLPAALRARLQRQADAECISLQPYARFAPEMQLAVLTSLIGRRDGLDPEYGIDVALAGWAHGAGKPVSSLETPELQAEVLTLPSSAETIEFVRDELEMLEGGLARPALLRVATVWADADLAALTHYFEWCDCVRNAIDRAAIVRLLDARNPGLADGIAALHARGGHVFAAVGSLHMIGPLGLPALLAERGFIVERLWPPR